MPHTAVATGRLPAEPPAFVTAGACAMATSGGMMRMRGWLYTCCQPLTWGLTSDLWQDPGRAQYGRVNHVDGGPPRSAGRSEQRSCDLRQRPTIGRGSV